MLEVKNISKSFKKRKILDSISLSIKKGEILGILGPNGVGKTTLLNIIELHNLILILKKKNLGIIIVDHNYTEVMKKADRLCLFFEGKKYFDGKPGDFMKDENVKKYYIGVVE